MGQLNSDATPENYSGLDVLGQRHKSKPLFNVPGVFVGFSPKASESDSVRSPTSPLDFRVFSNLTNPVRSLHEGHHKSWTPGKVGLRIIDSLDDDSDHSGKIVRSSESKNVLFGPQMRAKVLNFCNPKESSETPKSLPKSCGVFPSTLIKPSDKLGTDDPVGISETIRQPELFAKETRSEHETFGKTISCSLDSASAGSHLTNLTSFSAKLSSVKFGSGNGTNLESSSPLQSAAGNQDLLHTSATKKGSNSICSPKDVIGTLSAEEIELSEDYTCIKTYGPNPKTTHIFCDCILECHNNNFTSKSDQQKIQVPPPAVFGGLTCSGAMPSRCPSGDFLSFCCSCKKKLEGEDIYMYRGEKAFCSWSCRSQQILMEEAVENNAPETNNNDESSGTCIFIAA